MGYTHYMYLNRRGPQEEWAKAVMAAKQIIDASPVPLGDGYGEGPGPRMTDKGIYTNGRGEDSHETLFVPTVLPSLEPLSSGSARDAYAGDTSFEFCKTAQKPYDVVVTAVYAALAHIAGQECVTVHSDGGAADWEAGCALASKVLGQQIPIPAGLDQ